MHLFYPKLKKLPTHNHPRVNFTLLPIRSNEDEWHSLQGVRGSD